MVHVHKCEICPDWAFLKPDYEAVKTIVVHIIRTQVRNTKPETPRPTDSKTQG